MPVTGKYDLELNIIGDGRVFLNFWDHIHGDDVVAEIKEGELFVGEEKTKKITFQDFVDAVEKSVSTWTYNK